MSQTYRSRAGLSKTGFKVEIVTLTLNTGQGQSFEGLKWLTKSEYISITASIYVFKGSKMKKPTKYQNRFCGCMRNFEKTAPEDPPILLMICKSLKTIKEVR